MSYNSALASYDDYVEAVLAGTIPACKFIHLACERSVQDMHRAAIGDVGFPYYFDPKAADRTIEFIQLLWPSKGEWAGRPLVLLLRTCLPFEYSVQRDEVRKVADELKIAGTAFTTVTVNKNLRTACHKDEGDLRQGTGCMATLGQWQGSELAIPQFGLAVNYQPGDLLLGDVHLWHGNAPFVEGGERVTTVLYCRERMHECGSDSGEDNK